MLRAELSRARLFSKPQVENPEEKLEPGVVELTNNDDMPLLRQLSIASTCSDVSETDLLNSPASSPRTEELRSIELSLLEDQLKQCQKELNRALQVKDQRQKALASVSQTIQSSHAKLLNNKVLAPLFWNTSEEEVKLTDEEIKAGFIVLPKSEDLVREDTSGEFGKKKQEEKPEKFHRPLRINAANSDPKVKAIKKEILNIYSIKQSIRQQLQEALKQIEEITLDIQETEANISSEKSRIIEVQKISLARNFFTLYPSGVITLPHAEDQQEFKRQRL